MPSVAIVILNWNGKNFLERFLPSVLADDFPGADVIIADNGSTDDSVDFLQQHYPQLRIIRNNRNEGFAKGYNIALKQVVSDYYVLLNNDVEVTKGWIKPVIDLMENDPGIAACQPKLLSYNNKRVFEYAGASGGWLDFLAYPFMRGRIFEDCEEDNGQYDDAVPCFWASGAALFVRASVYHQLGGLDEYFFAHQEEIDLCWRIQLAGHKVYVQPSSVVYHVGGGSLPKGNSRKVFLNFRNNIIMLAKNSTSLDALWKVPVRIFLDALSAWRGLFSGDNRYFFAIMKAHFHFFWWLIFYRKLSVFPAHKRGELQGMHRRSVVWAYFIRKKKTFLEIVGNK